MRKVLIKDIGKVITGNTPSKSNVEFYESDDIGFVKPDIINDAGITSINSTNEYISEKARNKARIVKKDTIFITCIGSIGKIGIAEGKEYAFNQQINAIETGDKVISKYLAYNLLSNKNRLVSMANAPVVPIINKTQFENFEIGINEDVDNQKKIVDILDKVTKIISLKKTQLNELDNLIKSRFVEMFGNPITNNHKWQIDCLCDIGELRRGVSKHRPRNAPELLNGDYPLIQTGDIANSDLYITEYNSTYSELGLNQSKMWEKGTLCITIAANIAKTGILDFDSCFPDSVVGFVPSEKTNNIFIHYWFGFFQQLIESQAPESAQKNINLKILSELKVIVPPLDSQNQFATFVQQTDKLKVEVQRSLDETQKLFESLMQKYFS